MNFRHANHPVHLLMLHAEAGRIPEMRAEELAALVQDIRERGVRQPLELLPGSRTVLDGRSRLAAAKEAGLTEVPCVDAPINGDDAVVYMIRSATRRRHLTDSQRAMLAEEERAYLAEKGKDRRKQGTSDDGQAGGRGRKKPGGDVRPEVSGTVADAPKHSPIAATSPVTVSTPSRARDVVARAHNVSGHKVRQAQLVAKHDSRLAKAVRDGKIPLPQAVREVHKTQRREALEQKVARLPVTPAAELPWRLIQGDCIEQMNALPRAAFRLVFADPPYNIGIVYDKANPKSDRRKEEDFFDWTRRWIEAAIPLLTDDGSLWVMIDDDHHIGVGEILAKSGLHHRRTIVWPETFAQHCETNFAKAARFIYYFCRDEKRRVFNGDAIRVPSARLQIYNDARANPDGRVPGCVWDDISRVAGTFKERQADFPTQLPVKLVERAILAATDPGDQVLDPFNGSGTTGEAAIINGRQYTGIELLPANVHAADLRLRAALAERKVS